MRKKIVAQRSVFDHAIDLLITNVQTEQEVEKDERHYRQ